MLTKATRADIDAHIAMLYELSQDLTRSSFPTYTDGIKTKEEFYETAYSAIDAEGEEILLYSEDGEVLGWIHYYWMPDDKYLSFVVFDLRRGFERAIDEFLALARKRFPGYQVDFGFPRDNRAALSHLESLGWRILEESDVFVLHFRDYEPLPEAPGLIAVTEENFARFRALHDQQTDMYWNTERLLTAVRGETKYPWRIFLYHEGGEDLGCVYFTYARYTMEIFGVDHKDGFFRGDVMKALLVKALNESKREGQEHVTYFTEGEESAVARELPFRFVAQYVAYTGQL